MFSTISLPLRMVSQKRLHPAIPAGSGGRKQRRTAGRSRDDTTPRPLSGRDLPLPLLDMLRYHKFLRANTGFGVRSADDPVQFKTLRGYSPYHQVKPAETIRSYAGQCDADTRVDPLHARKMTALLQAVASLQRPTLLRYSSKAGHMSGARPVSQTIDDTLAELSFLFLQLENASENSRLKAVFFQVAGSNHPQRARKLQGRLDVLAQIL